MKCKTCKHKKVHKKGNTVVAYCELNMKEWKIKDKDCYETDSH